MAFFYTFFTHFLRDLRCRRLKLLINCGLIVVLASYTSISLNYKDAKFSRRRIVTGCCQSPSPHNTVTISHFKLSNTKLILKWPSQSVNFISVVTSCTGLWEEEPQTAHPTSFTWASHIAASMLMGRTLRSTQSINQPTQSLQ